MDKERRENNFNAHEKAYRNGLRRRTGDKVEIRSFYLLLFVILAIYTLFIIGVILGWGSA